MSRRAVLVSAPGNRRCRLRPTTMAGDPPMCRRQCFHCRKKDAPDTRPREWRNRDGDRWREAAYPVECPSITVSEACPVSRNSGSLSRLRRAVGIVQIGRQRRCAEGRKEVLHPFSGPNRIKRARAKFSTMLPDNWRSSRAKTTDAVGGVQGSGACRGVNSISRAFRQCRIGIAPATGIGHGRRRCEVGDGVVTCLSAARYRRSRR